MAPITNTDLDLLAQEVIESLAGPDARVRPDQMEAVRALVLDRRRALVVQATGWGKSAVYWIAARAVKKQEAGLVLVVSPLLSLMRDQVAAAQKAGLRAVTLNSSNTSDWFDVERSILLGEIDVLLVSPERLANPRFEREILQSIISRLGLLVIDEAHCISSWGHDFRPDYQRIARLLASNPSLPVLATTATANTRVTLDVADQLGSGTFVQRGPLGRDSLHLCVVPDLTLLERYAWVDDALNSLPGSGIVYALTVSDANRLAGFLKAQGHIVEAYTGQMETDDRERIEADLRANRLKAVVATSALGMGYDKPDLAFCIHAGSPSSPVDYYQQVGRAGRAMESAYVVLLPGSTDERLWEWFTTSSVPDPKHAKSVLDALQASDVPLSIPALEAATGVRRSKIELILKILAVDGATLRLSEGWEATGTPWVYDYSKYEALVAARRVEADIMRSYVNSSSCLETLLRISLDDDIPHAARCGRCSACTGSLPAGLPQMPSGASVKAAKGFLRGLDTVVEPRKLWASGMPWKGRITQELTAEPGRALAFADDPAWEEVAALTAPGTLDAPAPQWLLDALIPVLTRWDWSQRPQGVVPMPSSAHPLLIRSVVEHIAKVGRMPIVDALMFTGSRVPEDIAPSARGRLLGERLSLEPGVTIPKAPLLLVDDFLRTGWTATTASALLREAGATGVLPLVVHQRP